MGKPVKVLIVEDEVLLALELEALMRDQGFEIVGCAASAEDAIRLAREHRPDLTLLDMNLKDGVTGPAIAKIICDEDLSSVIFVTAQANLLPDDLCGAFGVIEKPYQADILTRAVSFAVACIQGDADALELPSAFRTNTARS